MAFTVIASSQVDALSPVDDLLMGTIKDDLDYLNSIFAAGYAMFQWKITGSLAPLGSYKKALDGSVIYGSWTPSFARASMQRSGTSGTLTYDVRKAQQTNTPIIGVDYQYTAATQSISQAGGSLSTQSITRSTPQISTQSITHAKAAGNVQSIINVGGNFWQYNLDITPDSDYAIGDSVTFAGCTNGANNVTAAIVEINRSGHNCVVISNASGVAQTGVAGTAQLKIMSYNYTNPVSTQFTTGESASFASHTTGANNGTFSVYKINQSGNNVWVKNSTGATQAGVAGTLDVLRFCYNQSSAVSTTDYIVGEKLKAASHTSGANNGNFTITGVNVGGNNVTAYNTAGVVQGGVAGNVNTNRWLYLYLVDPGANSDVVAGHTVDMRSHTTGANNATFTVKEVNRGGGANLNIIVYNESGVAQAGVAGSAFSTRKKVKFTANQSSIYTTLSFIEIKGCPEMLMNEMEGRAPFQVLEVNRGGGSNYNVVIDVPTAVNQSNPAGYVQCEMKSIFNTVPSITADVTGNQENQWDTNTFTDFVGTAIAAGTPLLLYITAVQSGNPIDFSLTLH